MATIGISSVASTLNSLIGLKEMAMPKAKVYARLDLGEVAFAKYCVEGLHVDLVRQGWGVTPTRTVTLCDRTCEGQPTVEEIDFSDVAVQKLRALLPSTPEDPCE